MFAAKDVPDETDDHERGRNGRACPEDDAREEFMARREGRRRQGVAADRGHQKESDADADLSPMKSALLPSHSQILPQPATGGRSKMNPGGGSIVATCAINCGARRFLLGVSQAKSGAQSRSTTGRRG